MKPARAPARASRNDAPKHWLLTLHLDPHTHMHGYLMADSKRYALAAVDRMLSEAEKVSNYPLLSMVLMTTLSTEVELVREIVSKRSAEVKRLLETATDYHFSAWAMRDDDPDDIRLMRLH